jgi:hypothetical protein
MAARETVLVEVCKGTTLNIMPILCLKTEPPKIPPLLLRQCVYPNIREPPLKILNFQKMFISVLELAKFPFH